MSDEWDTLFGYLLVGVAVGAFLFVAYILGVNAGRVDCPSCEFEVEEKFIFESMLDCFKSEDNMDDIFCLGINTSESAIYVKIDKTKYFEWLKNKGYNEKFISQWFAYVYITEEYETNFMDILFNKSEVIE